MIHEEEAAYAFDRERIAEAEASAADIDFSAVDYVRTEWGAGRDVSEQMMDRARRETLGTEFSS